MGMKLAFLWSRRFDKLAEDAVHSSKIDRTQPLLLFRQRKHPGHSEDNQVPGNDGRQFQWELAGVLRKQFQIRDHGVFFLLWRMQDHSSFQFYQAVLKKLFFLRAGQLLQCHPRLSMQGVRKKAQNKQKIR